MFILLSFHWEKAGTWIWASKYLTNFSLTLFKPITWHKHLMTKILLVMKNYFQTKSYYENPSNDMSNVTPSDTIPLRLFFCITGFPNWLLSMMNHLLIMSNLISTNNVLETQCYVSFEILLSIAKDHIVIIKGIRRNSNYFVTYYKCFGYTASFPGCRWPRCALNASNLTPLTYTTLVHHEKWDISFLWLFWFQLG